MEDKLETLINDLRNDKNNDEYLNAICNIASEGSPKWIYIVLMENILQIPSLLKPLGIVFKRFSIKQRFPFIENSKNALKNLSSSTFFLDFLQTVSSLSNLKSTKNILLSLLFIAAKVNVNNNSLMKRICDCITNCDISFLMILDYHDRKIHWEQQQTNLHYNDYEYENENENNFEDDELDDDDDETDFPEWDETGIGCWLAARLIHRSVPSIVPPHICLIKGEKYLLSLMTPDPPEYAAAGVQALQSLVQGRVGQGWDPQHQTSGSCMQRISEALLTVSVTVPRPQVRSTAVSVFLDLHAQLPPQLRSRIYTHVLQHCPYSSGVSLVMDRVRGEMMREAAWLYTRAMDLSPNDPSLSLSSLSSSLSPSIGPCHPNNTHPYPRRFYQQVYRIWHDSAQVWDRCPGNHYNHNGDGNEAEEGKDMTPELVFLCPGMIQTVVDGGQRFLPTEMDGKGMKPREWEEGAETVLSALNTILMLLRSTVVTEGARYWDEEEEEDPGDDLPEGRKERKERKVRSRKQKLWEDVVEPLRRNVRISKKIDEYNNNNTTTAITTTDASETAVVWYEDAEGDPWRWEEGEEEDADICVEEEVIEVEEDEDEDEEGKKEEELRMQIRNDEKEAVDPHKHMEGHQGPAGLASFSVWADLVEKLCVDIRDAISPST